MDVKDGKISNFDTGSGMGVNSIKYLFVPNFECCMSLCASQFRGRFHVSTTYTAISACRNWIPGSTKDIVMVVAEGSPVHRSC